MKSILFIPFPYSLHFAVAFIILMTGNDCFAQQFNYGTGSVSGNPTITAATTVQGNNVTVTATDTFTGGTYNFNDFTINTGVTLTVTGSSPLIIRCTGSFKMVGTAMITAAGGIGSAGTKTAGGNGGAGVAGGMSGGQGGWNASSVGSSGYAYGVTAAGGGPGGNASTTTDGGAGAGYATAGTGGGTSTAGATSGSTPGSAYGSSNLQTDVTGCTACAPVNGPAAAIYLCGGSGGGGGGGDGSSMGSAYAAGGGGGGGGGGEIQVTADTIVIASGASITVAGGVGGAGYHNTSLNGYGGGGGGGSGGTISLQYFVYSNSGSGNLIVSGGTGGAGSASNKGNGGGGASGYLLTQKDMCIQPNAYSVSGGTNCGSSTPGLSGSQVNISYQLVLNGSTNVGSPVTGNGSAISFLNQSTAGTYTVMASGTEGCSATTATMTGSSIVHANPNVYTVTGGTNCGSSTPGLSGSDGSSVSYQLVRNGSTNVGSAITGSSAAFNFPSQPIAGTYTVVATLGSCSESMTGSSIVNANPGAVSINPTSATYYNGGSAVSLTASASGAPTFSWSPSPGLNTTSGATVLASPASTTTYTATASLGSCSTSNTVVVTYSSCTAGTWLGGASGAPTDWFTAANWSCGILPTATTDVTINGGLQYYPVITAGAPKTAYANNLTLGSAASLDVTDLNVNLQVNGNFINNSDGGLSTGEIAFQGNNAQTITGTNTFNNVLINNTNGVTIAPGEGNTQYVSGTLTLQNGTLTTNGNLTITANASGAGLINDFGGNSGSISGNVTVQRYVVNTNGGYYYIGSPVGAASTALSQWGTQFTIAGYNGASDGSQVVPSNCTWPVAATLASNSPYGTLYEYDESGVTTCYMQGWRVRLSGNITAGQGFAADIPNGAIISTTGTYNTGTMTKSLSAVSSVAHAAGYNLVSNPYASPVDWLQVASATGSNSNVITNGTAQMYESQGEYAGSYQPINLSSNSTYIGSSQAFFIKTGANGSTLTFNNSMRTTGSGNGFLREAPVYTQKLSIDVKGNGYGDVTNILFGPTFTDSLDYGYDAFKMMSSEGHPSLYVTDAENVYSIYAIPVVSQAERDIPVSLVPGANGNFSFTVNLNNFDPTALVYLEDKQQNVLQNLMVNPNYSFSANATDDPARFVLHFVPAAATTSGINSVPEASVVITGYANNVIINFSRFTTPEEVTVNVYDVTGRRIIEPQIVSTGDNRHVISMGEIATGYYFVVLSGQDYKKEEKVFLGIH